VMGSCVCQNLQKQPTVVRTVGFKVSLRGMIVSGAVLNFETLGA